MILPSAIKAGRKGIRVTNEGGGVFIVSNAYEGTIEYFPGRPLGTVDSQGNIDLDSSVTDILDAAEVIPDQVSAEGK